MGDMDNKPPPMKFSMNTGQLTALIEMLQERITFLKQNSPPVKAQSPAPAQLAAFLRGITTSIQTNFAAASPDVMRIVKRNFSYIGWDVVKNGSSSPKPPTGELVDKWLTDLVTKLVERRDNPPLKPNDEELGDLSKACNRLWDLDIMRLTPGVEYQLNIQRGKKPYQQGDHAPDNLFTWVRPEVFRGELYQKLYALLDNYERTTGVSEDVTTYEKKENWAFIEAVMKTQVMRYAWNYLVAWKKASPNEAEFKKQLYQIWFEIYSRGKGIYDSSGFEHVFVGETKDGKVTGFHNWVQIYIEEQKGSLDYMGYIKPKQKGNNFSSPDDNEQLMSIQFAWDGELKSVSTSLIGTSPEFEMALYTLCFLCGEEKNLVQLGPYRAQVTCYKWDSRGKTYIASSFPEEAPMSEDYAATKIQSQFKGKKARFGRK